MASVADERSPVDRAYLPAVPESIRRDFVLPDRFLDEDVRPWRDEMRRRFGPLAGDCKTRKEAILRIATDAAKICGVDYSTGRRAANQGVMESLGSRRASCTGLSILLAAAYRSVGIPARLAGVGEWGDRPGNHTWVEVWDGDWHAIEYYPDPKGWDHGWFYEPVVNDDPANPRSRVRAAVPGGPEIFFLPWAPANTSVRGVDRMADYRRVAASLGVRRTKARPGMMLVPVVAEAGGARVAVAFRISDGDKVLFDARTPGPLDDLNNAPRAELAPGKTYVFEYTDNTGTKRTRSLTIKTGEPAVLPL